jgi:hypothetical protein
MMTRRRGILSKLSARNFKLRQEVLAQGHHAVPEGLHLLRMVDDNDTALLTRDLQHAQATNQIQLTPILQERQLILRAQSRSKSQPCFCGERLQILFRGLVSLATFPNH